MLGQAIKRFTENLDALREFVEVTKPFLESRRDDLLKGRAKDLGPMILAMDAMPDNDFDLTEEQRQKVVDSFDGEMSVELKEEDEISGKVTIAMKGGGEEKFHDAMTRLNRIERHTHLLHANSLIALVGAVEWFLSEILHVHFEAHPDSAGIRDKTLSLKDLMQLGSVEDAQRYLIDLKVEEVLRGSFKDWIAFVKERLKLSMGYVDSEKEHLVEICQRRHLLVHNGGHINQIYLNKVKPELWASPKLDSQVDVPKEYLERAVDVFERVLCLIAFELWKKQDPENPARASLLVHLAFERLKQENWCVAEGLSYFLMNDKAMPEREKLIGQLNYWQSLKWQDRYDEVRADVEGADYSAKDELYQLALAALKGDTAEFLRLVPKVLKAESLSLEQIHEWPIFRAIRETEEFKQAYPKDEMNNNEP